MAAVSAQTITEKRCGAGPAIATKTNQIYTRTVTFPITAGETAGTANLTGFTIPANTLIMGGTVKFSVAQGGTITWKFSVATDGDFCTATGSDTAYNTTSRKPLVTPIQVVTTADRQVTYTTAAAAIPAGAGQTCELTLILCNVGAAENSYSTFSI